MDLGYSGLTPHSVRFRADVLSLQHVVMTLSSSIVTRPVCVYHHATCVMARTTVETGPTNATAVSHMLIVLSTHMHIPIKDDTVAEN